MQLLSGRLQWMFGAGCDVADEKKFHTWSLNQQSLNIEWTTPLTSPPVYHSRHANEIFSTSMQLMQAHRHRCEAPVLLCQMRIQGNETRKASPLTKRPTKCCGRQPPRLVKHLLVTQSSLFRGFAGKQQSSNALTLAVCEAFHLDAKNNSRCLSRKVPSVTESF